MAHKVWVAKVEALKQKTEEKRKTGEETRGGMAPFVEGKTGG